MTPSQWSLALWWVVVIAVAFHLLAGVKVTATDTVVVVLCLIGRELALLREGKR